MSAEAAGLAPSPPPAEDAPSSRPRKVKMRATKGKHGSASEGSSRRRGRARSGAAPSTMVFTRASMCSLLEEQGLSTEREAVRSSIDLLFADLDDHEALSVSAALARLPEEDIITRALTGELAVPNWQKFTADVVELMEDVRADPSVKGENASYIPILAEADPTLFGISITTVDGQQFNYGDTDEQFSIQSCVKPLIYAAALEEHGLKRVHRHVGSEPSGLAFNEVSLNSDKLPHNPMVNPGAISTGALVRPDLGSAAKFRFFTSWISKLAGGLPIKFSNPTYLCEQETAYRNQALMYYMQEAGVFPKSSDPAEVLDFYIQCCAIEVNTRIASNVAGTLAKGGIDPLNLTKCMSPQTVKSCLTLMFSCGMYDYSGTWCVRVGLPAKSGVAGLVYVVIPHVMGIALFSPPLDARGNSSRGVAFMERLLRRYHYGIFDRIMLDASEKTARGEEEEEEEESKADSSAKLADVVTSASISDIAVGSGISAVRRSRSPGSRPGSAEGPPSRPPSGPPSLARAPSRATAAAYAERAGRARRAAMCARLLRKIGRLHSAFVNLDSADKNAVPTRRVQALLSKHGVLETDGRVPPLLAKMEKTPGIIRFQDIFCRGEGQDPRDDNLVMKALLNTFVMPSFHVFASVMRSMYRAVEKHGGAEEAVPLSAASSVYASAGVAAGERDMNAFGVSIVTVDGQRLNIGDSDVEFPLSSASKAVLYAMALRDNGLSRVGEFVGTEPTAADPQGFDLHEPSGDVTHPFPHNPFMDSGALAVCSLLKPELTAGGRYRYLLSNFSDLVDSSERITFNQPMYLSLKDTALRARAVAHFIKGMDCLPEGTDPDALASTYFQSCAVEFTTKSLASMGATLANLGVNPFTSKACFDKPTMQRVFSMLYSCGMNQFTGKWDFTVGIPAQAAPCGSVLLIIPNVMGIAIYSPPCNDFGVSLRGLSFSRALTNKYRVNIFDQLVYGDKQIKSEESKDSVTAKSTAAFYLLCVSAGEGNLPRVRHLMEESTAAMESWADYDKRTALHIACSDGHLEVARYLVSAGADILAKDRWGSTPLSDARASGNDALVSMLESALLGQGVLEKDLAREAEAVGVLASLLGSPMAKAKPEGDVPPSPSPIDIGAVRAPPADATIRFRDVDVADVESIDAKDDGKEDDDDEYEEVEYEVEVEVEVEEDDVDARV